MEIKNFFILRYDETLLFMMNFCILLLALFTPFIPNLMRYSFIDNPDSDSISLGIVILLVLITSLVLSAYQVFTKRRKSLFEKRIMLALIILINTVVGYLAALLVIMSVEGVKSFAIVFPIINLLGSLSLFFSLLTEKISTDNISSQNSRPREIIAGALITLIIFFLSQNSYGASLLMSFSAMLGMVMVFHRLIPFFFAKNPDYIE